MISSDLWNKSHDTDGGDQSPASNRREWNAQLERPIIESVKLLALLHSENEEESKVILPG